MATPNRARPMIAITPDVYDREVSKSQRMTIRVAETYAAAIERAGGTPVVLPPIEALAGEYAAAFAGFVLTGGDDPIMEPFGVETHPEVVRVHERRQAFEVALLRALRESRPETPVLGVCLGMQYMGLVAGAGLDQHMPETMEDASLHWEGWHPIEPEPGIESDLWPFGTGEVHSKHRQRLLDGGSLTVLARSPDGVIEAVGDPGRPYYLGVQWHPERTVEPRLGQGLFDALVDAAL